jgi:hypothetical protein
MPKSWPMTNLQQKLVFRAIDFPIPVAPGTHPGSPRNARYGRHSRQCKKTKQALLNEQAFRVNGFLKTDPSEKKSAGSPVLATC